MGSLNMEALGGVGSVVVTDCRQRASKASFSNQTFLCLFSSQATSRMLTLTSFPQRSMLAYGARYLQDYFSDWVKENGGYVSEDAPK